MSYLLEQLFAHIKCVMVSAITNQVASHFQFKQYRLQDLTLYSAQCQETVQLIGDPQLWILAVFCPLEYVELSMIMLQSYFYIFCEGTWEG